MNNNFLGAGTTQNLGSLFGLEEGCFKWGWGTSQRVSSAAEITKSTAISIPACQEMR